MSRTLRRILAIALVVFVTAGLVALGVRELLNRVNLPLAQQSRCDLPGTGYSLSTEQAANAATVTAVAITRKLPQRAAVIAIATALQESKLVNVEHGDRDSLGLFQQRPSQGWGTPTQVLDPRYAVGKFYDKLVKVRDWKTRPITQVAQAVQQSAYPEAYQQWEDQATVLARAFSGQSPAAVNCTFPAPTRAATPERIVALLTIELPSTALTTQTSSAEVKPAGWTPTLWLVAKADRLGIESVSYAGQRWSRTAGWKQDPTARQDRVRFVVANITQTAAPSPQTAG